jgi:hypothetical protein
MLIADFRTGKMTKLAIDWKGLFSILLPGAVGGIGGLGAGGLIDIIRGYGTQEYTKTLGLIGLLGGLGYGGIRELLEYLFNDQKKEK